MLNPIEKFKVAILHLHRAWNHCTLFGGMLNFGWATFLYSGSGFDYGIAWEIAQLLATLEMCLIDMVPLGLISFCCLKTLWDRTCRQSLNR